MPTCRRPTRSRYANPFERIDHQFDDQSKEIRALGVKLDRVIDQLGKHRKEEKDNGKRIDALTKEIRKMREKT